MDKSKIKSFDRENDKDLKMLMRSIDRLKEKGVTIELVEDMILLIDNNAEEDEVIESLGGCG